MSADMYIDEDTLDITDESYIHIYPFAPLGWRGYKEGHDEVVRREQWDRVVHQLVGHWKEEDRVHAPGRARS